MRDAGLTHASALPGIYSLHGLICLPVVHSQEHGQAVDPNLVQLAAAHEQALAHAIQAEPSDSRLELSEQATTDSARPGPAEDDAEVDHPEQGDDLQQGKGGTLKARLIKARKPASSDGSLSKAAVSLEKQKRRPGLARLHAKQHELEQRSP